MAFLEAFFVGRRPPPFPLFIQLIEVSTSALEEREDDPWGRAWWNKSMNRWMIPQGDLDVDLEDAKAEKNNRSTKREGAIRCFFLLV